MAKTHDEKVRITVGTFCLLGTCFVWVGSSYVTQVSWCSLALRLPNTNSNVLVGSSVRSSSSKSRFSPCSWRLSAPQRSPSCCRASSCAGTALHGQHICHAPMSMHHAFAAVPIHFPHCCAGTSSSYSAAVRRRAMHHPLQVCWLKAIEAIGRSDRGALEYAIMRMGLTAPLTNLLRTLHQMQMGWTACWTSQRVCQVRAPDFPLVCLHTVPYALHM